MLKALSPVALLLIPALLLAQPKSVGSVRGVVFDSITTSPVTKAAVWVSGSSRSAVAGPNGRFELSDVPVGTQFISFSSPALDSLGIGTLGSNIVVQANAINQVRLTVPSFRSVWRALCSDGTNAVKDSGIVWGTIRDAATHLRLSGARASFSWTDLRVGADKKIESADVVRSVNSDSTGSYYACGLPDGINVNANAEGAHSASGVVSYTIGAHRIVRVDLLVSTEMVATNGAVVQGKPDSSTTKLSGSSSVRGIVVANGAHALADATITLPVIDTTARSGEEGKFAFDHLPAGTQLVEIRKVGYAPKQVLVDLRPGATTDVNVALSKINELATVHVRDKNMGADRSDFESRRAAGFGYFFDEKNFKDKIGWNSVLQGSVPGAYIAAGVNGLSIRMNQQSFTGGHTCAPTVWLDGVKTDITMASSLPLENYRAVEIYPHVGSAPPSYIGFNACGVVLFWTKSARW